MSTPALHTPDPYTSIRTEVPVPGVGLIRLERPKALNALNQAVQAEVLAAASAFDTDPEIGAIVVTGSERAFAAGADIAEMAALDYSDTERLFDGWDRLAQLGTPLVAAVSGYALGGGCELAMLCDVLIAADTAVFGQPEINLGILPGIGGSQRLAHAVGKAKAMDLVLTGRTMDVHEAERAGLVSRIVPATDLLDEAVAVAATIASKSKPAVLAAKQAVNRAFETGLTEGVRFERALFRGRFATMDRAEGMAAFLEKREPRFTDR
ncbi:enoyl-CoA hydratase [Streptomyces brasiliensis]|uniref:enoyl-CoA hydratase n=1 Tax=Streptomyces brasiliensis TaxID=1954 RepID=A0A917LCJ1_9ACTN|nr:enoyl-CoA hydratase [Streptomyces brasiliensis]